MLLNYIQSYEAEREGSLPALELAYNTDHTSTELSSFEAMTNENPLTAASLVSHCHRAPDLFPPEAVAGWPPIRDVAGNLVVECAVNYILDQRDSGSASRLRTEPHRNLLTILPDAQLRLP
ncbi:hypothetical protein EBH_0005000 [Eimeria brunetti]|uniref:Uncharacterized protein n=1 Tax=Eimeria brunetti TaxID=51314 RepID=U6LYA6_9EIME|nr:hypothetical protein EBH_0005000 [Eimeria brunetti]